MAPGGERLHLVGARHACLEQQDGISYMPNDVHFDQGTNTLLSIDKQDIIFEQTLAKFYPDIIVAVGFKKSSPHM